MRLVKLPVVAHLTSDPSAFRRTIRLRPSPSAMSWEGIGLSITIDDEEVLEAWSSIANLASTSIRLCRTDGNPGLFVLWSKALERQAMKWAVEHGWLEMSPGWEVSWYDSELDERVSSVFAERDEAQIETEDQEDVRIRRVPMYLPTKRLATRWEKHFRKGARSEFATVEATNLYVAEVNHDADGIWWAERLDPAALSAPRGVILPHALAHWGACQT